MSDTESSEPSRSAQQVEQAPADVNARNRPTIGPVYAPQHLLEFFNSKHYNSKSTSSVPQPSRHLAALNLSIRIQGTPITDKLLWSVFLLDPFTKNPHADALGYGGEALSAYAAALLTDFGLEASTTNVAQVCASAMSQMDVVRCAVLVPDETDAMERRGRGRAFDRMVKVDLPDINDFVFINAWTNDSEIQELVNTLAVELSLKPAVKNAIEWTIFRTAINHRQLFLDNFPHIQTGILRVVNAKRQEARLAAAGFHK